jgi:Amt family ammonium transporter
MDKADLAWVGVSTLLVILMVLPGLALFYGGLVRSKNVLSILMQVLTTFSLAIVLWFAYGYSIAFSDGNGFFGGLSKAFFSGLFTPEDGKFAMSGTIPEVLFAAFQATFAGITCALIVGSFAERAKFSGVLVFTVIWFTFGYLPIAHMVWFTGETSVGYLFNKGALDFAGGTVVHINAGIAGLVGAFVVGKRIGYG